MIADVARISVAEMPARTGNCELCAAEPAELGVVIVVQHSRGGTVQFVACGRCARAARRLVAAIGGQRDVAATRAPATPEPTTATGASFVRPPVLIGIVPDGFVGSDGARYMVRLYGDQRADGMWVGWIEFEATDSGVTLRTDRETTQSNQEQLSYWASGLQATYFEGAFSRARQRVQP
jgi:hypothetical protein